jgi:hypothetical protein
MARERFGENAGASGLTPVAKCTQPQFRPRLLMLMLKNSSALMLMRHLSRICSARRDYG